MKWSKGQIILVVGISILTVVLFSLDIKGLASKKASVANSQEGSAQEVTLNAEEMIKEAKANLDLQQKDKIEQLQKAVESEKELERKVQLLGELSNAWLKLGFAPVSAIYKFQQAEAKPNLQSWLASGDAFLSALEQSRDSVFNKAGLFKAQQSFRNALDLDASNLDAKTGMGVVLVSGAGAPMEGIKLLKEVVEQDPKNLKANTNLGLFSVRSGQYDKAVERFKTVIAIQPSAEAYFYLAESYKGLGKAEEAIAAYNKCKTFVTDPSFVKAIDGFIKELSK